MSSSIDQQFIEFVVKSLVSNPDAVSVERTIDEKGVLLELTVDPEDLGRVIGKRGATAQSLRTLLRALGTKNDARYNLKIVDNGEPMNRPVSQTSSRQQDDDSGASPVASSYSNNDPEDEAAAAISEEETDHNDALNKTRRELAELDDLDV